MARSFDAGVRNPSPCTSPAGSFLGGFRTPARRDGPLIRRRRPEPFTENPSPKRSLDRAVGINRPDQVNPPDRLVPWVSVHAGCFNAAVSIGIFLRRLPVAAKIALATAGT